MGATETENGAVVTTYNINRMRVHYFFTEKKDADLKDFIDKTEIELRITNGNWFKPLCKGSCYPMQHFNMSHS